MKLYELTEQFKQLNAEDIDPLTMSDTLESMELEIADKCKNVAAYFQNLDCDVKALKEAEQRIAQRRKAIEKNSEYLKNYLLRNMQECEISKIECPEFKVTLGKPSQVVEIIDIDMLDSEYVTVKTIMTPDKNTIKRQIKLGVEIPGAELVDGKSRLIIK